MQRDWTDIIRYACWLMSWAKPITLASYQCLFRPWISNYNDRVMIPCVNGVTTKDPVSSQERMHLDDLAKLHVLRIRRLRCHGHVERSDGWLKKVQKLNPTGGRDRGCPMKTWTEVIGMKRLALGLKQTHPSDRKACSGRLGCVVRLDLPLD